MSTIRHLKILISTGDVSGDIHASRVIKAVRALDPSVGFFGLGGPRMREEGFRALYDSSELAVVGLTEVAEKFTSIARAYRVLRRSFDTEKPSLVVLVDFPDFNLLLAGAAKKRGIPVLYYISPQIWAWRRRRVRKICKRVDRMAVILPFEAPLYEKVGLKAEYVGHPLLEEPLTLDMRRFYDLTGLEEGRRIVALLPGSRSKEVERIAPVLMGAAGILGKAFPDIAFVMPLAPGFSTEAVHPIEGVKVIQGMVPEALHASALAIVTSGTATLEAALTGTPMIIVYKLSSLSYWLARSLVAVKNMGLVNLVAGKRIVPELVQSDAVPERIAEEAQRLLTDEALCVKMKDELKGVVEKLAGPSRHVGASRRVADIILSMVSLKK